MEVEDILNYVMNTPGNTNPNVLKPMLNELKGGSGGGSSYKLLASQEVTVNQTSSTATNVLDIPLPNDRFSNAFLYVRIRDKAGKRNGYFYGSDNFCIDLPNANSSNTAQMIIPKVLYYIDNNGLFKDPTRTELYAPLDGWGVSVNMVNNSKGVRITARYSSALGGIINGTFKVDVYALSFPDGNEI